MGSLQDEREKNKKYEMLQKNGEITKVLEKNTEKMNKLEVDMQKKNEKMKEYDN